jgi:hypothetical protein
MEILTPITDMLRRNQARLADDDDKQQMVCLRFRKPIPKAFAWEFLRIHLTPELLRRSESGFFRHERFQPQYSRCSQCWRSLTPKRDDGDWGQCTNPACSRYGRYELMRPVRGVVRVDIPSDAIVAVDGRELCSTLVLVLDRRYKPEVLAAVYRTAGMICDKYGWEML